MQLKITTDSSLSYKPGDIVSGTLSFTSPSNEDFTLQQVELSLLGQISLLKSQPSSSAQIQPSRNSLSLSPSRRVRRFTQTTYLNSFLSSSGFMEPDWERIDLASSSVTHTPPQISEGDSPSRTFMAVDASGLAKLVRVSPLAETSFIKYTFQLPLQAIRDPHADRAQDLQELYGIVASEFESTRIEPLDTFHGKRIDVSYNVRCVAQFKRTRSSFGLLNTVLGSSGTSLTVDEEAEVLVKTFSLDSPTTDVPKVIPYPFVISETSVDGTLSMHGTFENVKVHVDQPLVGWFQIEQGSELVSSIELQLNRVETVDVHPAFVSEVMTVELATGNIVPEFQIPIFFVLPQWLSGPSLVNVDRRFSLTFELKLIVRFKSNRSCEKTIPVQIEKSRTPKLDISDVFGRAITFEQ